MDHTVCGHQVAVWNIHRVDVNRVVDLEIKTISEMSLKRLLSQINLWHQHLLNPLFLCKTFILNKRNSHTVAPVLAVTSGSSIPKFPAVLLSSQHWRSCWEGWGLVSSLLYFLCLPHSIFPLASVISLYSLLFSYYYSVYYFICVWLIWCFKSVIHGKYISTKQTGGELEDEVGLKFWVGVKTDVKSCQGLHSKSLPLVLTLLLGGF